MHTSPRPAAPEMPAVTTICVVPFTAVTVAAAPNPLGETKPLRFVDYEKPGIFKRLFGGK